MERARIVTAFHLLAQSEEASVLLHYAQRLGSMSICLRGHDLAAAAEALRSERDAAVSAARMSWRASEQGAVMRSVGLLMASRKVTKRTDLEIGAHEASVFAVPKRDRHRSISRPRPRMRSSKGSAPPAPK
jgi:hypothetical protein